MICLVVRTYSKGMCIYTSHKKYLYFNSSGAFTHTNTHTHIDCIKMNERINE